MLISSRNRVQICSKGQRRERPAGKDFRPSIPECVNQLIQRPTDERAQQRVLATSLDPFTPMKHQHGRESAGMIFIARFMNSFLHQASFATGYMVL
ncbi:Uncharacterised protein [Kluyvera cryocrescens]|uniref:Uncharacterized protein n=1 Tax=Kluyvera cryocrescens TaxID=580 RepID=A0A485CJT6_KLUCR|nr:Uncharacterised protein [Kluyvera cryocrescens]